MNTYNAIVNVNNQPHSFTIYNSPSITNAARLANDHFARRAAKANLNPVSIEVTEVRKIN